VRKNPQGIHLGATDRRGAVMSSTLLYSDAKWLRKMCERIELHASRAHPKDQFYMRVTTTEVKRAKRIADNLRWMIQHIDVGKLAGEDFE
jgi:hypothetical protein